MPTPDELRTTDENLRAEAGDLLNISGLRDLLARRGTVHPTGSYMLGTMVWRDLDIMLETKDLDEPGFFGLGADIALLLHPARMNYHNAVLEPTPDSPRGLYWGIRLGRLDERGWKIDLWALEPDVAKSRRAFQDRLASKMDDAKRDVVLAVKTAVWNDPRYRKSISAMDVYSAVLDGGVTDVSGFWGWVGNRKG